MKRVVITLSVFLSSISAINLAMACPDISGTYYCNANPSHPDMLYSFSQTETGDHCTFKVQSQLLSGKKFSDFTFVTDGKEHDVIDEVTGSLLKVTASCDAKELTVTGLAALNKPKPIRFSEVLSLTPDGDLYDVSIDINGATVHEICIRQ